MDANFAWLQQSDLPKILLHATPGAGVVRQAALDVASYVGGEIDITLRGSFWQGRVALEGGYGRLLAREYVRSTGPSTDADFFYLQTKISR